MNIDTNAENLHEFYSMLMAQISQVDELLDSTTDQKSAGKRALRNALVNEYSEVWTPVTVSLVEKVSDFDDRQQAAVFFAIIRELESAFNKTADAYLDAIFESQPKAETVSVSEDEIKALNEQRSALYKNIKTVRELALVFGGTEADYPMPKVRTGARGPRGKRAINEYSWSINGEALTGDDNSLLAISKKYEYASSAELRKAMLATLTDSEGKPLKDLKDPPNPIVFTLPNGDVLTGNRPVNLNDDEDDDEGDEDTED